ncbi:MAG TPA: alcohol dehydrogenase catalytic domain-containing protein [Rhizomicrobium sp.]|jgi:S-(hydroxymethyl)glutathione dehydrogenase/alcohol dehydrogenase|nr:alcohol dehydrogenase catalytic domain-containing protein [Rhizomicrobium sp.]
MPRLSKALVTTGDAGFALADVELGEPQRDEVLVQIMASGVCHTDLDMLNRRFAHVMGHEGAGTVLQCGSGVDHVGPGDPVVLNWAIPCGECFQCRRGAENICAQRPHVPHERRSFNGKPLYASFGLGTMATHTVVPKQAVVKIDVEIAFPSAALLGCGVMTGFGSVTNAAKVKPGSSVVVLGTGGVGLSCIQGAVHACAGMIIAVDINPKRLELARQFGATHTLLASKDDAGLIGASKQVKTLIGRGADYAFECTAVPELGAAPLAMVCNGGVAIAVSGIEQVVPIDMQLFEFDKLYMTPLYGQCRPSIDFPMLLSLYKQKRLKLDEMVTRTYPLSREGLTEAFEHMRQGVNAKGVLIP